jgi:TolA-binding protein
MKTRLLCAVAAGFAMSQVAAPAYAETPQFRAVEAQSFSAEDMQMYGLSAEESARAAELQAQGYKIVALTPEEAEAYQAGITQTEWILIGIGVLIILAIA